MKIIKTIILDDEAPALSIMTSFVKKVPFLSLELATANAFEALEKLHSTSIDLLMLDIEMPDISGLELLKSLQQRPLVILTTAYEQYALEGYELDVLDYLVKPIRFERFLKAVNKVHRFMPPSVTHTPTVGAFLQVKVDYKTVNIPVDEILFIEGLKDYVKIFTNSAMILTRLNLSGINKKLDPKYFLRVHRSYIVALEKITAFQKQQITIDGHSIPIGPSYQAEAVRRIENK
ncbi:MAG: LytTR family DNA-binding domain-containing protein [Bacteroidota bacterium]